MPDVRRVAKALAADGSILITQKSATIPAPFLFKGPIRLKLPPRPPPSTSSFFIPRVAKKNAAALRIANVDIAEQIGSN